MQRNALRSTWIATLITLTLLWSTAWAQAVGHTPGAGWVSNSGEARYRVPLSVPPGVNGLEPRLALSYGHRAGDGPIGVGWSIEGLSAIERCSRNLALDGEIAAVNLSGSDRLCLDGQRLRLTGGTYLLSGSTYQTEIESFARITANGSGGQPATWFRIEGKDGLYYHYGNTADSRIEGQGSTAVRIWALNRIEDRAGNYLTISYTKDGTNGSFRPAAVHYTGTSSSAPSHSVVFAYEERPLLDRPGGYVAGGLSLETHRLTRIEARSGSTVVRRFDLAYAPVGATGRSRLESIQECGLNAAACFSPTLMTWVESATGWGSETETMTIDNADSAIPGDFDGDGFEDLAWFDSGSGTWKILRGTAEGYLSSTVNTLFGSSAHFHAALAGDLDGSGRPGLLVPHTDNVWHWLRHNGTAFSFSSTGIPSTAAAGNTILADINGDGLDDLVYLQGGKIYWRRNTTSSGQLTFATPAELWTLPPFLVGEPNSLGSTQQQFRSSIRVSDFNGDGRADLLLSTRYDQCQNEPACPTMWLFELRALISTDSGLVPQLLYSDTTPLPSPPLLGDFNGDGLTDILYAKGSPAVWKIRFATGARSPAVAGFTPEINTNVMAPGHAVAVVTDFDGDGRTDVVAPIGGTLHVCRSSGSGETLLPCAPTGVVAGSYWKVTDIDGSGLPDLAYMIGNTWRSRRHNGGIADALDKVTDGFGNYIAFSYSTLPRTSAYTKGGGAVFPDKDLIAPISIVTELQSSDGIAGSYSLTYEYEGARVNQHGRGFLGFASRRVHDSRTGFQTVESFRQDHPYIGLVENQVTWQSNGTTKVSETSSTWQALSYSSGYQSRYFPYLAEKVETAYEVGGPFNGQAVSSVTTTASYDTWGNPVDTLVSTTAAGSGQAYTSRTVIPAPSVNMLNDTTQWCLGKPRRVEVENSRPGSDPLTRTATAEYDPVMCRMTGAALEPEAADPRVRVSRAFAYDTCGNQTGVTVTGDRGDGTIVSRTSTRAYGWNCRFPQIITNSAGHQNDLVWDPVTGAQTDHFDQNGLHTHWSHDEFGRLQREDRPDGGFTTWNYSWCSTGCGLGHAQGRYRLTVSDSSGAWRSEVRDTFDRVVRESSVLLGGASSHVDTVYNSRGLQASRSLPHSGGNVQWATFGHDLLGRLVVEQPPGLPATTISYERLETKVTDARQNATRTFRNPLGETVQVKDAIGSSIHYHYDSFGNLKGTSRPGHASILLGYDIRGRRLSSSDSDMGNWSYQYNSFDELIAQTDAKGQTVTFVYDSLGRLANRVEPEGTTTWSWDSAPNGIGNLDMVSSPGGYAEVYSYDALSRPVEVGTVIGGEVFPITTTYDAQGRIATVEYPESVEDLWVPATPATISVPTSSSTGSYTISWASSGGSTSYELYEATNGSFSGETLVYSGSATSWAFSGQGNGSYYYRVKACNAAGCSTPRAGTNGIVVTLAPGAPSSISVPPSSTSGSYSVSWGSATGAVTAYQLFEANNAGFSGQQEVYSGTATSKAISGKENGTFHYRVRACNGGACSAYQTGSNPTSVTLPPSVPGSITAPASSSNGNYTVSWGSSNGAVTAYQLYQSTNSSFSGQVQVYSGTGTSRAFSGQANGIYYYRVRACNGTACSEYRTASNATNVTLTPSIPASISVPSSSSGNHTVSWGSSSGSVTAYELYQSTSSNFSGQVQVYSGTGTSRSFSGHLAGTYYYRVRACNGTACSGYRTGSNPTVVSLPVPATPSSIFIPTGNEPVFFVSWAASSGTVESYQLYSSTNSTFSSQTMVYNGPATGATMYIWVDGSYWYRVRACNSSGCSGYRAGGPKQVSTGGDINAVGDDEGSSPVGWVEEPAPLVDGLQIAPGAVVAEARVSSLQGGEWVSVAVASHLAPATQPNLATVHPSGLPAEVLEEQARLRRLARHVREQRPTRSRGVPTEADLVPAVARWLNEPLDSLAARVQGQFGVQLVQSSGGQPHRFRVRYEYDGFGHLLRVVNDQDGTEVFWQATEMNSAGQVTGVQYGNGLSSSRLYDAVTGLVTHIDTGNVQSLRYESDAVGNLLFRQDLLQGVSESFQYDALNRLESVSGPSPMVINYDTSGNIDSKTGVGTYSYHPQHPHQVVSTTSGGSYDYDANGNMKTRNGASIAWTSYNQPSTLSAGGNTASFSYGAWRQRFRQVAVSGGVTSETIYVAGGLYERVTVAGTSEHRHYIQAGGEVVAVHTRRSDHQHETRYLHADHLGSVEAITDAQGTLLARLSFDAFGKRRGSNWTGSPSANDQIVIGSTTSRGYTFHEMLDDLGLVHMNGRVYDPHLGRFLSADPFVPAPFNLQSFNRYSYVFNNPLSLVDPTGYMPAQQDELENVHEEGIDGFTVWGQPIDKSDQVWAASDGRWGPAADGSGERGGSGDGRQSEPVGEIVGVCARDPECSAWRSSSRMSEANRRIDALLARLAIEENRRSIILFGHYDREYGSGTDFANPNNWVGVPGDILDRTGQDVLKAWTYSAIIIGAGPLVPRLAPIVRRHGVELTVEVILNVNVMTAPMTHLNPHSPVPPIMSSGYYIRHVPNPVARAGYVMVSGGR